jgi:catalase
LNKVGKRTPVFTRFSTVGGEKGSADAERDPRGFAVKFYTEDGNWDLTGNNIPVFFIRDGYQFTDLVHALRPNPVNHIQEGWRILDYLGSFPESTNILTWLLGDEGIPKNWRTMDGYGVNTFILKNGEKETYVKFHFRAEDGAQYMTDEEAVQAGETNMRHSHATHDLFNHIGSGKEAVWNFSIQTMDIAEGDSGKFGFDPLDCTKEWPEDQFPLQPVGRMVLNENISNFHNESEQIAFSPGTVVPGICLSNDKILQTRAFSYADAHRYRLGVNYQELPINAPKFPYHANQEGGVMNSMQKDEQVNYWPSLAEHTDEVEPQKGTFPKANGPTGDREKSDYGNGSSIIGDDFKQAGDRIRSFDPERLERFKGHVVAWMTDPKCSEKIANLWFEHWLKVDKAFGEDLKNTVMESTGGKFGHPKAVPASKA